MKSAAVALLAVAAVTLPAQQSKSDPQIAIGRPISKQPPLNPPTLPFRTPVNRAVPPNPYKPARVVYVPQYYPYYPTYPQQPQTNVSVNVTNIIETPPPVTMIAPVMYAPLSGNARLWDAEADLAESNARERGEPDARGEPRDVEPADVKSPEAIVVMTVDEYASVAGPALEGGVYQREVTRSIQQYGAIAHVFSTYECRKTTSDEKPFQRGINSIQLLNDGTRWWIMSVSWDSERPGMPVPAKYLAPAPTPKKQH
jgi:hypothetical protein